MKAHPLFEGIDFNNLHNITPPPVDIHSPFRKKKGQNLIEPSFTEAVEILKLEKMSSVSSQDSINELKSSFGPEQKSSFGPEQKSSFGSGQKSSFGPGQKSSFGPGQNLSSNQIRVILSGLVNKKCGWLFYKPRQLILTDVPKLVYYDPANNALKVFYYMIN